MPREAKKSEMPRSNVFLGDGATGVAPSPNRYPSGLSDGPYELPLELYDTNAHE